MISNLTFGAVVALCVWGVLDARIRTRTAGTLALSLIAIIAYMHIT